MSRNFEVIKVRFEEMSWLFPCEVVERLELLQKQLDLKPQDSQSRQTQSASVLEAIESLQTVLDAPGMQQEPRRVAAHLSADHREILAYELAQSLARARKTQLQAPDTPLGFLRGKKEMLAALLSGGWYYPRSEAEGDYIRSGILEDS